MPQVTVYNPGAGGEGVRLERRCLQRGGGKGKRILLLESSGQESCLGIASVALPGARAVQLA